MVGSSRIGHLVWLSALGLLCVTPEMHLQDHIRMGQAIGPLRDEGVLLFGSGLSYHSMPGFSRNGGVSHASVASKVCYSAVNLLECCLPPIAA